jgi:hypothetical protein
VGCEREYIQVSYAFNTLIGPYIDKRLARALHKRWLPPIITPKPRRGSDGRDTVGDKEAAVGYERISGNVGSKAWKRLARENGWRCMSDHAIPYCDRETS